MQRRTLAPSRLWRSNGSLFLRACLYTASVRPRLLLASQTLGQEDLEERLIRNVATIRKYFEILDHRDW
jgi:hypothetical protein